MRARLWAFLAVFILPVLRPVGHDACLPTRLTGRHWVEGALQGSDVDLDDRSGRLRGAEDGVGDNPNRFQIIGSR